MAISSTDDDRLMVTAIDFGTTFSGYAFSMRSDFNDEPLQKIYTPNWNAPSASLISHKTPSTVLLDHDQNFVAFGYDAEAKYAELAEDEDHEDYFYFRRFKMMLYDKVRKERLTTETKVPDITGKKELPAVIVFMHAIKYLRDHLLNSLRTKGSGIKESDINWVLTVPAIWDDPAKQFMRTAAEMAGIARSKLMIALEPEAASIFCKHLPTTRLEGDERKIGVFQPGSKYLVLDAGGGTVDITVHEVKPEGKLHELDRASGGDWGGVSVDMTFKQTLMDVVGESYMEVYCHKHTGDYIDIFRDFEMKKRKRSEGKQSKVTLKIPASFTELFEEIEDADIQDCTQNCKHKSQLKWEGDKLRIKQQLFDRFFEPACNGIIQHVRELLKSPKVKGTNIILMVGGFSESPLLQEAIRNAFPSCRVIIPQEAGLAVLKGAVLYGHNPLAISARIAKYTYGIATNMNFDAQNHDRLKMETFDGVEMCTDIFHQHVGKGSVLLVDDAQGKQTYTPVTPDQTQIEFSLYVSEEEETPMYIDDPGCKYLGTLTVDIPDTTGGKDRQITAQIIFGGTELTVKAENVRSGEITSAEFNFLGDEP